MKVTSSRQRRLLTELDQADPALAAKKPIAPVPTPEPEPEPELAAEPASRETPAQTDEKPKLSDAEKMAYSMNNIAKLKMCLEIVKQAGYELSGGDKSFSLGGMANPISGTLATPVSHLDSIIKRLEKDLFDKASKRGQDVAQAYQQLSTPSPQLARIARAVAMLPIPVELQSTNMSGADTPTAESIEYAMDEIGLTESERIILYGAINEAVVTGMIAFKPYDKINPEVPNKKKRLKDSDFPEWYGEYLSS